MDHLFQSCDAEIVVGPISSGHRLAKCWYLSSVQGEFSESEDGVVPDVTLLVAGLIEEELEQRVHERVLWKLKEPRMRLLVLRYFYHSPGQGTIKDDL